MFVLAKRISGPSREDLSFRNPSRGMVTLFLFFMPLWAPWQHNGLIPSLLICVLPWSWTGKENCGVFSNVVHQSELSAPRGGSVLFQVKLTTDAELNSIFWTSNRSGHHQMVAIAKPDGCKVIDVSFRNRMRCQEPGLSLILSDLREEDSATYKAQLFGTGDVTLLYFHLQVKAGSPSGGAPGTRNNIHLTACGLLLAYIIRETSSL